MSRNIMNITKWLPLENEDNKTVYVEFHKLKEEADAFVVRLAGYLNNLRVLHWVSLQELNEVVEEAQHILMKYKDMRFKTDLQIVVHNFKMRNIVQILWKIKLKISYLLQQLITETLVLSFKEGEKLLENIFKLTNIYNELLSLDTKYALHKQSSMCVNTCPTLLFPAKKISVTKILQTLAQTRAENCCHRLIDCLLEIYKPFETHDNGDGDNNSDTSSIEIYRALTRHMTPPLDIQELKDLSKKETDDENHVSDEEEEHLEALEILIHSEEKQVTMLLNVAMRIAPKMLGVDGVKKSKTNGELRVSHKATTKVMDYYQQILWGEVGNYLEHVVLWWGSAPLASRSPHSSQHLRDWILQFTPTAKIPQTITAALHSLSDALGCHVTSTSWDQHFRAALVAAHSGNNDSGKLFAEVLRELVMLTNACEATSEWMVGAPLDELPLVEQIPVLHRLDHSVHTTRLWAASATRKFANNWNMDSFFSVTQSDISGCLLELDDLRVPSRIDDIERGRLPVHVQVCANMREKLISEVRVNIDKLKEVTKECLDVLASICKTVSLANLKMVFPNRKHWSKTDYEPPKKPNSYVAAYFDKVLLPVLEATNDHTTSNMVLRIMGEAWLDHIYMHKIKFSQWGAVQLLTDFGSVAEWLVNCPIITQDVRKHMLRNEVLRKCEGVGRLLLRSPGEPIDMGKKNKKGHHNDRETNSDSTSAETMPAEMYVPNQEQWLELRASKKKSIFVKSLCCGTDS